MVSAHDVAAYILEKHGPMSAMKLQKLVYYSQAWSLVWEDRPLFPERIEAWAHGPVVPELYREHHGEFDVRGWPRGIAAALPADDRETVDAVPGYYGNHDAQVLSDWTHSEDPWKHARAGLGDGERGNAEITLESMMEYCRSLQPRGRKASTPHSAFDRGAYKAPRSAFEGAAEKRPRGEPPPVPRRNPLWAFRVIDVGGPWGWTVLGGDDLAQVLLRLKQLESMTWGEIEGAENLAAGRPATGCASCGTTTYRPCSRSGSPDAAASTACATSTSSPSSGGTPSTRSIPRPGSTPEPASPPRPLSAESTLPRAFTRTARIQPPVSR